MINVPKRAPMPAAPADVAAPPADAEKTASGLASKQLRAGDGGAKPGATSVVTVHYTGWTTDGKAFDSSVARGKPATFPLNRVIAGWTEGLQLMTVGEERRFWIPQTWRTRDVPDLPQECSYSMLNFSSSRTPLQLLQGAKFPRASPSLASPFSGSLKALRSAFFIPLKTQRRVALYPGFRCLLARVVQSRLWHSRALIKSQ